MRVPAGFHLFLLNSGRSAHGFFHRLTAGHGANGSLFGGNQIGRRVGKPKHLVQIPGGQPVQAVFQYKIQNAGAEGVPRPGGFNDAAQGAPRLEGMEIPIESICFTSCSPPGRYSWCLS